jgi:hypothetical protein
MQYMRSKPVDSHPSSITRNWIQYNGQADDESDDEYRSRYASSCIVNVSNFNDIKANVLNTINTAAADDDDDSLYDLFNQQKITRRRSRRSDWYERSRHFQTRCLGNLPQY